MHEVKTFVLLSGFSLKKLKVSHFNFASEWSIFGITVEKLSFFLVDPGGFLSRNLFFIFYFFAMNNATLKFIRYWNSSS